MTGALAGKVAVVTGATSGIGAATAVAFAHEGADVTIVGRRADAAEATAVAVRGAGRDALIVLGDVSDSTFCDEVIASAVAKFGVVDVLANVAGVITRGDATETSDEEWHRNMAVNAGSVFFMSRAAVRAMRSNSGGGVIVIVNLASNVGLVGATSLPAYCASKGAVVLLTKAMALDHAAEQIRINALCPGAVDTPMLVSEHRASGLTEAEAIELNIAGIPEGRVPRPDEIAKSIDGVSCQRLLQPYHRCRPGDRWRVHSRMSATLDGRVAVVTGGARSIGAAIADGLAVRGATVVVGDLDLSLRHESLTLDVSDETSVRDFVAAVLAHYGRLDIVVNNAGIMFEKHLAEQDRESWDRMLAVNLTGPMLMTREAAPHLATNRVGSVINVSSLEGTACNPAHSAYAATKAGIEGLTRATAVDLGSDGTRCNAIAPGWIDSPLNAAYIESHPDRELVVAELEKLHPVGRIGDPADVSDVAAWLAGDESRFVTGQVITVDGGRTTRPSLPSIMNR